MEIKYMDLYSKLFIYIHTCPTCIHTHTCILKHIYFKVNWSQSLLQQVLSKLVFGRKKSTAMWYIWFAIKVVRWQQEDGLSWEHVLSRELLSLYQHTTVPRHSSVPAGKTCRSCTATPLNLSRCSKTSKER